MLQKNGQLKIKNKNGKIVAEPDLKTAIGSGATRKYAVGKKGIRYRKIYKTKESRYMHTIEDIVGFATANIEKKKIDVSDAAITGVTTGLGGGTGTGWLLGEYLGRKNKNKHKYGVAGAVAGTLGLGGLGAYQNLRQQRLSNSSSMLSHQAEFASTKDKPVSNIKRVKPYKRNGRMVSGYIVDSKTGKKRYLSAAEMHYEKNQRAKEELEYKMRRLEQAKAREERLQREDKRRPVDDVRKNVSTAVNVSREAKGWLNTGNKLLGWFK